MHVNVSQPLWTNISANIGWIAMNFYTDVRALQTMNTDFGDPMTFPLATSSGQNFIFSYMTFSSASTVLVLCANKPIGMLPLSL